MNIKKNKLYKNIKNVVIANTHMTESALLNDNHEYKVKHLDKVVHAIKNTSKVTNCSDYDVDGITSAYIIKKVCESLGKESVTRLPRRFSEGFGLSMNAIDEIDEGLLLTTDNGISAIEPVKKAKDKGLQVIITDHHLADGELPEADLIIDPMAIPKQAEFSAYCGAGLAYKLAETVCDEETLNELSIIASIGTIADSVALIDDNRKIVKKGLQAIKEGLSPLGLKKLFEKMAIDESHISAEDIAYKIAPALNAPGRLEDNGAEKSLSLLLSNDESEASRIADEIISYNDKRKKLVDIALCLCQSAIDQNDLDLKAPIIIKIEEMEEGIVGIVAGQLAEKYKMPTFVLVKGEDGNYKGSARAPIGFHLKKMLDEVQDTLIRYGGHAQAAGLTVDFNKFEEFTIGLYSQFKDYKPVAPVTLYDLKVSSSKLDEINKELELYAPYGEGNPAPIIYVDDFELCPDKKGDTYKIINEKGIKLNGANASAIDFNGALKYLEGECSPDKLEIVGTLRSNWWNGWEFLQIQMLDFEAAPDKSYSLANAVKNKLALMRGESSSDESEDASTM